MSFEYEWKKTVKYVLFLTMFSLIQREPILEVNLQCVKLLLLSAVKIKYSRIFPNNVGRTFRTQKNTRKSLMSF
jgi:hypothetical protein